MMRRAAVHPRGSHYGPEECAVVTTRAHCHTTPGRLALIFHGESESASDPGGTTAWPWDQHFKWESGPPSLPQH